MVRTKHASNDPRGGADPTEPDISFNQKWFKTAIFEDKWNSEFKKRHIISGRDFEKSFPGSYAHQMTHPMDVLGWTNFRPLPKMVYTKLVRAFYCNLEIGLIDDHEYSVDSRVRGKNIILNPSILSEITGISNEGECVFISKPSQLENYVSRKRMNEIISGEGQIRVTQTKHLRPEFRLFHRYIAFNIIPKAGHYDQVTTMDAFIIYKAAMEEPLNLNYIILKEMADVRNHNTRSLPYGAFLSSIFFHFNVNLNNQPSVKIDRGFSKTTIKKAKHLGLDREIEEEEMADPMNFEQAIVQAEGIRVSPTPQEQRTDVGHETDPVSPDLGHGPGYGTDTFDFDEDPNRGYETDILGDDILRGPQMDTTFSPPREVPVQGESSRQEDPPSWVIDLQASLQEIKQQQAAIIQTQKQQQEHMGHLESAFYEIRNDMERIRNLNVGQSSRINQIHYCCEAMQDEQNQEFINIHDNLKAIWFTLDHYPPPFDPTFPPPPPPYNPNIPPRPPPYRDPPY